jgi:hypothetical protein
MSQILKVLGLLLTILALFLGYHENKLKQEHHGPTDCKKLKLGEEDPYFTKELQKYMPKLLQTLESFMDQRAEGKLDDPSKDGKYRRVQHPLSWGCLFNKVELEILPIKSPQLQHGLFQKPAKYPAYIRVSKNGFDNDNEPRTASIAIKVIGVKGERAKVAEFDDGIEHANMNTLDLIFISYPSLPLVVVPEELITVHEALMRGKLPAVLLWMAMSRPTLMTRAVAMLLNGTSINNPFLSPQFTIGATKLGPNLATRYALFPCTEEEMPSAPKGSTNYVQQVTQDFLNKKEVCMKLMIQPQTDPCKDRVDSFLEAWTGPWEHVGYLRIQKDAQLVNDDKCENLSMNPWHTLEANAPLGWVQSARRDIYSMGSARRLHKNKAKATATIA